MVTSILHHLWFSTLYSLDTTSQPSVQEHLPLTSFLVDPYMLVCVANGRKLEFSFNTTASCSQSMWQVNWTEQCVQLQVRPNTSNAWKDPTSSHRQAGEW